jgi:hypothetical protein
MPRLCAALQMSRRKRPLCVNPPSASANCSRTVFSIEVNTRDIRLARYIT